MSLFPLYDGKDLAKYWGIPKTIPIEPKKHIRKSWVLMSVLIIGAAVFYYLIWE